MPGPPGIPCWSAVLPAVFSGVLHRTAARSRHTAQVLYSYVSEIQSGLTALGNGRLNYQSDVEFKGDFVAVSNGLKEISRLLRSSLQQINNSAEQVSLGAEQVSNSSQVLAQGASEQAGSIEELAVSINEIAESVKNNADSAVDSSRG